jgi:hypothetical protein
LETRRSALDRGSRFLLSSAAPRDDRRRGDGLLTLHADTPFVVVAVKITRSVSPYREAFAETAVAADDVSGGTRSIGRGVSSKEGAMSKIEAVHRATGRTRAEWFAALDAWGAPGRPYREIADWLTGEHDLSRWWAQKLIVEYEQERGLRPPGMRPNGTFEVSASKTVEVPVERLFGAFVDSRQRRKWLTEGRMSLRASEPGRSASFDWNEGSTRVNVSFLDKGRSKSTVAVLHGRLTDARRAQSTKAMWRERLVELKSFLEA